MSHQDSVGSERGCHAPIPMIEKNHAENVSGVLDEIEHRSHEEPGENLGRGGFHYLSFLLIGRNLLEPERRFLSANFTVSQVIFDSDPSITTHAYDAVCAPLDAGFVCGDAANLISLFEFFLRQDIYRFARRCFRMVEPNARSKGVKRLS